LDVQRGQRLILREVVGGDPNLRATRPARYAGIRARRPLAGGQREQAHQGGYGQRSQQAATAGRRHSDPPCTRNSRVGLVAVTPMTSPAKGPNLPGNRVLSKVITPQEVRMPPDAIASQGTSALPTSGPIPVGPSASIVRVRRRR